jgi:hypothetical protein
MKKLAGIGKKLDILYSYKANYDILNSTVNDYQKINLERNYMEHYNIIKSKHRVMEEIRIKEKSLLQLKNEYDLSEKLNESKSIFQDSERVNIKLKELESQKLFLKMN